MRREIACTVFLLLSSAASIAAQATPSPAESVLEIRKPVEKQISAKETHSYQIPVTKGQFASGAVEQRGIDLVVTVFAPDGKSLAVIDSPNGDQGDEPFSFVADQSGSYRIQVHSLDSTAATGRYQARIKEILSPQQYQARLAAERADIAIVSRWLSSNAIPLRTVVAGGSTADLQPLKTVFGNARIVALGEATHGSREIFQAKHRLIEFLVKEMGFRVFAIEASQAGCEVINDYVMGRMSDGAKALDSQGFWTWNTEEVRDLLDWLRSYNRTVPPERKVSVVGFDLQLNLRGQEFLQSYLMKVAPQRAARLKALPLAQSAIAAVRDTISSMEAITQAAMAGPADKRAPAIARTTEMKSAYNELLGWLTLNEFDLSRRSTASQHADAVRYTRLIAQYLASYTGETIGNGRDGYMAENIVRLVNAAPRGTRFVLWAHNGHIERSDAIQGSIPMGGILASVYGDAYYSLGFSFNQGSFQSRNLDPPAKMALTSFTVGPAADRTLDWYLARPALPVYVIDFRHTPRNAAVRSWLSKPLVARWMGAVYRADAPGSSLGDVTPVKQFDGMLFIDRTTRARPNPSVANVARDSVAR